jgi:hypothetical protein
MMVHSVPRSVVSRLLSVATVLTLVGFAANGDLQPASALASPAVSVDLVDGASYLEDENRNNNEHNGNGGNAGGEEIFSLICSVPGFANNVGCATGLLGN